MRKTYLVFIGLLTCIFCNSQNLVKNNWVADIDFLANELPQKHYNLFVTKDNKAFKEGLDKIKIKTDELTDFEVALKLQQLISTFGDSHTNVNYSPYIEKNNVLPFHLYWFSDGVYILSTTQENIEILGHQILSINGIPLKTISDSLSTLTTNDNESMIRNSIPKLLPSVKILEYFGISKRQQVELELKDQNDAKKTYVIKPSELNRQNRKMFMPNSVALCYKNERAFFIDYIQLNDKIYYIQYNKCWSRELELQNGNAQSAETMPSFKDFEEKVFQTLKTNSIDKIVFDIRFNSGGSSAQGTQFAEKLSKYLKMNPKIKMYVILGRTTFSSAIINAIDFKRLANAIFVGEETAGKPNHFGEVRNFLLPNSHLKINYSTKYFKLTDDNANTINPDIRLEPSFADFIKGFDPAYEWIKKQ